MAQIKRYKLLKGEVYGKSPAADALKDIRKLSTFLSEYEIKEYLLKRVRELRGEARKVRWEGRRSAPDWRVWLPGCNPFWIELKASNKKPTRAQAREIYMMRHYGDVVFWANSPSLIDEAIIKARYA